MPPEADRVQDKTIWGMVNRVRSFAKKTESAEKADKSPH